MISKTQLLTLAALLFVTVSIKGQIIVDDYNNCASNPNQFVVTQIMGNADFLTQEVFPGECELVYLGAPGMSITEALYPPFDLTQPLYGLNAGEPADIQFHLNYDGNNPNPGNVLKFVIFDPNPQELFQFNLDQPFNGPVQFQLPAAGMLNNPFAFVVEGNDTPVLVIDQLEVIPEFNELPCDLVDLGDDPPLDPTGPGPCEVLVGTLVYIVTVDGTDLDQPVFCAEASSLIEAVLGLPTVTTSSEVVTNGSTEVLIIFVYFPKDCEDGDPCTNDFCDPNTGDCVHVPYWEYDFNNPPASPDPCFEYIGSEASANGVLVSSSLPAGYTPSENDLSVIQSDTVLDGTDPVCDWIVNHVFAPIDCDDGDPCTNDICILGSCIHTPVYAEAGIPPASPDPCFEWIGMEVVLNGVYNAEASVGLDGYIPGPDDIVLIQSDTETDDNEEVCDWIVSHVYAPIDCDDGDPCTNDLCINGICVHTPVYAEAGIPPPSPDPCFEWIGMEVVLNGVYNADASVGLDGYVPGPDDITIIQSDTETDDNEEVCDWIVSHVYAPIDCDDGDPCTTDSCVDGECVHLPAWETALTPPASPGPCYVYLGVEVIANFVYQSDVSTVPMSYIANPHPDEIVHISSETQVEDNVVICDWIVSHTFVPIDCDDGDPCTDDSCEDGVCVHKPKWEDALTPPAAPEPCYDYIGVEVYVNGSIDVGLSTLPGGYVSDPSHIHAITSETTVEDFVTVCDWIVDHVFVPRTCDDGDPCTYDYCDPATNMCVYDPYWLQDAVFLGEQPCFEFQGIHVYLNDTYYPGLSSADGYVIQGNDNVFDQSGSAADGALCTWTILHIYSPLDCNDNDPCTADSCDPSTGDCVHTPKNLTTTVTSEDATCPTYDNGEILLTVSGSHGPYTVVLQELLLTGLGFPSPPDTVTVGGDLKWVGLAPGSYLLTITDADGCAKTIGKTVEAGSKIDIYPTPGPPSCWNANDGSIVWKVGDFVAPLEYICQKLQEDGTYGPEILGSTTAPIGDSGDINITYTGLGRGTYRLSVQDAIDCVESEICELVPENKLITASASALDQTCPGVCDGEITLSFGGGNVIYGFQFSFDNGVTWSTLAPGQTDVTLLGYCKGTYDILTRNTKPCPGPAISVSIDGPDDWNTAVAVLDNACHGDEEGEVAIEWMGGTPLYTTTFNGGTLPAPAGPGVLMPGNPNVGKFNLVELGAGDYTMTITDSRGCQKILNWSVVQPEPFSVDTTATGLSLNGDDGFIETSTSGGTEPYNYSWKHNDALISALPNIYDLEPGLFELYASDDEGCADTLQVNLGGIPLTLDTDGEGLTDWEEENIYFTNAADPDSDGDLLTDWEEIHIYGTDPNNPDTDGDGVQDGDEVYFTLTDPLVPDNGTSALEPGCTYPDALNYSAAADFEDGSCVFDTSGESCEGDANGDGEVGTADILSVLGGFGTSCEP